MRWVGLTMRVSKFGQVMFAGFSGGQRTRGDSREVEEGVQVRLSEGEFGVFHLTF